MRFQNPMAMSSRLQLSQSQSPSSSQSPPASPTAATHASSPRLSRKNSLFKMKSLKDLKGTISFETEKELPLPPLPVTVGSGDGQSTLFGKSSQREKRIKGLDSPIRPASAYLASPIIPARTASSTPPSTSSSSSSPEMLFSKSTPRQTSSTPSSSPSPSPKKSIFNLKNLSSGHLLLSSSSSSTKPKSKLVGLGMRFVTPDEEIPPMPRIIRINDQPISKPQPISSTSIPIHSTSAFTQGPTLHRTISSDSLLSSISSDEDFASYALDFTADFPAPPELSLPVTSASRPRPKSMVAPGSPKVLALPPASQLPSPFVTAKNTDSELKKLQALKAETTQMYNLAQSCDIMSMVNLAPAKLALPNGPPIEPKRMARKAVPKFAGVEEQSERITTNEVVAAPTLDAFFQAPASSTSSPSSFYKNARATQSVAVLSSTQTASRNASPSSPSIPFRMDSLGSPTMKSFFSPTYTMSRPFRPPALHLRSSSGSSAESYDRLSTPPLSSSSSSTKSSSGSDDSMPSTPSLEMSPSSVGSSAASSSSFQVQQHAPFLNATAGRKPNYFLAVDVIAPSEAALEEQQEQGRYHHRESVMAALGPMKVHQQKSSKGMENGKRGTQGFWAKTFAKGGKKEKGLGGNVVVL